MIDLTVFAQPAPEFVPGFMSNLEKIRQTETQETWKTFVKSNPVIKAWRFYLSIDPYTRWGLVKPRGYPGDATLMDFAYGHPSIKDRVADSGQLGAQIYKHTSGAPQSASARQRVNLMAQKITDLAGKSPSMRIASFAAGHARELESLEPSIKKTITSFTALDLDPFSLSQAQQSAQEMKFVSARKNVIKDDLSDLEEFDLVYSLGLFDYLSTEFAEAVLAKMLQKTTEGGQCVIANLAPDAANLGYCEAIMDWWMITRSAEDMQRLGETVNQRLEVNWPIQVSRHGCFNYLTIGEV